MNKLDDDEQFYRDTERIAFPKLDDRQLAMLEPLGKSRIVRRGEIIFKAGQRDLALTVILRGEIEVFEPRDGQEQILATGGPRDFTGDVAMLTGTAALASARGKAEESEILEVPAERLRHALAELPGVAEPLVRAFIMRRLRLKRDPEFAGLRILTEERSREGTRRFSRQESHPAPVDWRPKRIRPDPVRTPAPGLARPARAHHCEWHPAAPPFLARGRARGRPAATPGGG